jgi:hypothetical protein
MVQRTLVAGLGLATAVGALVMVSPRSPRHGGAMAMDSLRHAVEHVNTWHLKGWQRQGDKEILREVWGRRSPFCYHERIGDQEIFDDGTSRTIVFPPGGFYNTPRATVLKIPSRPDTRNSMGLAYALGLEQQPNNRAIEPWRRDGETVTYRSVESVSLSNPATEVNDLLTFASDSPLPLRYEQLIRIAHVGKDAYGNDDVSHIRDSEVTRQWTRTHLDAQYDIDLDPGALHIETPADALTIDALRDAVSPDVPTQNAAARSGLTVGVSQGWMDAQGDVLLHLKAFAGNVDCDREPVPFRCVTSLCSGNVRDEQGIWRPSGFPDSLVARDDRGRYYVSVDSFEFLNRGRWAALAPLESLRAGEPLPRQLTLLVETALMKEEPLAAIDLGGGRTTHTMTTTELLRDLIPMTIELGFAPHRIDVLEMSRRYGNVRDVANGFATSYRAAAATARVTAWLQVAQTALERELNAARVEMERGAILSPFHAGSGVIRLSNASASIGAPTKTPQGYVMQKVVLHFYPAAERETRRALARASDCADEAARLSPRDGKRLKLNVNAAWRYFQSEHYFMHPIRSR